MKKPYWRKMMAPNSLFRAASIRMMALMAVFTLFKSDFTIQAQADSVERKKIRSFAAVSAVGYTAGILALNHVWYQHTERQSFRFFNDNAEWKQVDKAGHFFASFHLSQLPARMLSRYGVRERKADLIGAVSGFLLTAPIEILDGYSDGYGASVGDLVADAAGPVFYFGQKYAWGEVRIHPKFSFHRTGYAPLRPQLLGSDLLSEIVKDYNGQTYWLSFDADKFVPFPEWLNIAIGYGASDMIYARDAQNRSQGFHPYRQYYLAVDIDPTAIRTRSKLVKTLLYLINTVRLPAPAIEFSSGGTKFHPFYF